MAMTTKDKFHTADGRLTSYALNCGYIEQHETNPTGDIAVGSVSIRTTLWREGCCYHVRQHEFNGRGRVFWECFDILSAARQRFDATTK